MRSRPEEMEFTGAPRVIGLSDGPTRGERALAANSPMIKKDFMQIAYDTREPHPPLRRGGITRARSPRGGKSGAKRH